MFKHALLIQLFKKTLTTNTGISLFVI